MNLELIQFINTFPTPVRIIEIDSLGSPSYCAFNDAALQDARLEHKDIVGRTAIDLYPGVLGEIAHTRHLSVIQSKRPLTFDMDEDTPEGRRWIRTTLAPALDKKGKIEKIFCTQMDVTAEKQMQMIESDAESRVRDMEHYIAMAAHDLRSPMTNVQLIAKFIKEDFEDLDNDKLEMLDNLSIIAESSMALISDVLAHSLATSAVTELKTERFQLDELIANILSVLDPFSYSTLTCTPCTLAADNVAVQIAIHNLIDNALKHNKDSALHLEISVSQKNNAFLEFLVSDNGTGFGDKTKSFIESGVLTSASGFGLAGVSRLVRRLGGNIRIASEANQSGATIGFTLPGTLLDTETGR